MASSNNDNQFLNSRNVSNTTSISTPSNTSLSHISINDSPRRSARLASKSPQITPKSANPSNIHRTMSGGVNHSYSPKMNIRNRSSLSNGRGSYSNALSQSIFNDGVNIYDGNNHTTTTISSLPSDQSDDEEMVFDNNGNNNTAVLPKPSGLASRSQVLAHFEKQTIGFKCKICNKIYRASKLSDSNLRKHLSSCHQIPNVLFKSQINDDSKSYVTTISFERKRKLIDAAVDCVIEDGLSFDTFRRPGMARFLSVATPGFVGPHRKTVRRRIALLYSLHIAKLRSLMPKIGLIALTSDLWKNSRQVHFISLTAHAFTHSYEHVPIVLTCRRIIGQHLSSSIERYIKYELNRLGIDPAQIVSITTDNGSNMKKATSTFHFGQRISCMAHNLNLVVKKGLCLWIEPKPENFPLELEPDADEWVDIDDEDDDIDATSECDNDTIDTIVDLISDEDNSGNEDEPGVVATINSETEDDEYVDIQLSSLTLNDKNSSTINHFELLNNVYKLMKKSRLIIKFMKNHSTTNEYINKCIISNNNGHKSGGLVLDMLIRWNSSFLLLERLIMHKDIVNSIFAFPNNFSGLMDKQKKRLMELILNQHEWDLLQSLKHVLEPFADATNVLSGQSYPTMALSFYIFRLLTHFLETTSNDDSITIGLKESLRYWFHIQCKLKLPVGQIEIMTVAAFLDPTIYHLMNDIDRRAAKKIIFRKLNNTNVIHHTSSSSTTTSTAATTSGKLRPLEKLAALCGHTISSSSIAKKAMTLDEEISSYIKAAQSADNFQQFWTEHSEQLPRLSNLMRRTNIIPATSISSEALFSVASYIHRKQRSSLSSQSLRYLLVLKNRHVLEKFEQNY